MKRRNHSLCSSRSAAAAVAIGLLLSAATGTVDPAAAAEGDVMLVLPEHAPAQGTPFDVRLVVDTGASVLGGYELRVDFDTDILEFLSASPGAVAGFTNPIRVAAAELVDGSIRFGAYQRVSRTAPTGLLTLATLRMRVLGQPGQSSPMSLSVLKLLSAEVDDLFSQAISASVVVNLLPLGDLNGDGVAYQVSDAVFMTQSLLGYQVLTAPEISSSDVNGDGVTQSVADLVYLVNVLLGLQPPIAKQAPANVVAALGALQEQDDGFLMLPIEIEAGGELGGVLLKVALDPAVYQVGVPRLAERALGMDLAVRTTDEGLTLLVYGAKGQRLVAGDGPLVRIPVRARGRDPLDSSPAGTTSSDQDAIRLQVLQAADAAGTLVPGSIAAEGETSRPLPLRVALHPNAPNPFNPRTELAFDLPAANRARLALYDVAGRRVRVLVDRELPAGAYRTAWDAQDDRGRPVASGVYLARLEVAGQSPVARKLTLVR